ncbi:MAG: M20/M25/M40 family metallo-hydrolase [Proteobacteria bacterium]|nr:M20/M25/M40 family metallo-hydrolase [Pseudomonadota bacterium]
MRRHALASIIAVSTLFISSVVAADFNADEQRMIEWIDAHAENAIELLAETVNIGSGTMNHDGVREVGRVMRRELDGLGLDTEWIEMPPEVNRAGHLIGRKDGQGKKFLLIGHLDTVFEADDAFQSFERDGDMARGPGVEDMKAGNVIIVYALKALGEIGVLDNLAIVVAYTGDEEKSGQPLSISRKHLIEAGQWADVALGFESAINYDGKDWATVSRRSSSSWMLEVTGRQAHSSGIFSEDAGAGAIFEAARILHDFYVEVRGEEHLTFNAGTISGGTDVDYDAQQNRGHTFGKTNVIPRRVVVHGGIRTISDEQLERARDKMRVVVARSLPHTSATIEFQDRYPSMSPTDGNRRLMAEYSAINEALGRGPMPALDPSRRGAADISFVAPYADGLAGLGALGDGGHTPNESLDLTSMPLAIKRAAILIYRLSIEH